MQDDHPPRPPAHGKGNYRPDINTPDDDLEDELLEWLYEAASIHNRTTTEVEGLALDLKADTIVLKLRTGALATVSIKTKKAKNA